MEFWKFCVEALTLMKILGCLVGFVKRQGGSQHLSCTYSQYITFGNARGSCVLIFNWPSGYFSLSIWSEFINISVMDILVTISVNDQRDFQENIWMWTKKANGVDGVRDWMICKQWQRHFHLEGTELKNISWILELALLSRRKSGSISQIEDELDYALMQEKLVCFHFWKIIRPGQ